MGKERREKSVLIGVLCAVILFMAIGFASISSKLTITGTGTVGDTWNVQITDIQQKEASAGVVPAENTPSFSSTTANFNVKLKQPGDYVVYTITVKNQGTLDAILTQMTETYAEGGSDAIVFTVTPAEGSGQGQTLAKTNGVHTFDVKVEYLSSAIGENAPEANASKTLTLTLDYTQKTA